MAASQHKRTRSERGGASATPRRPLSWQPRSAAGGGGAPPTPAPAPAPAPTPTPASASAPSASSLSVFLTNLRLLDLDLAQDWPDLTPATFAGSAQNHKRRVQAVEWALYRLFEVWDPEETASKLKPYFPPLDQLQSVNLRAALLRALEAAKKNGVLGRDATIRKTMLEDCKGERLEEVLASFSAAVLRRRALVGHHHHHHHHHHDHDHDHHHDARTPGKRAACVPLVVREVVAPEMLRPLVIAYRASLGRTLDRRHDDDARFHDFGDLLAMKERALARRHETLGALACESSASAAARVSDDARRSVRQTVRNHWSGHETWMHTLLVGDGAAAAGRGTGILAASYERVWRCVQHGRLAELEDDGRGLLQQLDGRVELQKKRLARWDELRRDMVVVTAAAAMAGGDKLALAATPMTKRTTMAVSTATAANKPTRGIDLQFNAHKDLHVDSVRGRVLRCDDAHARQKLHPDYEAILRDLDQELTDIKTGGGSSSSSFELAMQRLARMRAQCDGGGQADDDYVSVRHPSSDPISELGDVGELDEEEEEEEEDCGAPRAQQGISSLNAPKRRHTLSLAERTRMSMARKSMHLLEDDEPELPATRTTCSYGGGGGGGEGGLMTKGSSSITEVAEVAEAAESDEDDLAGRTRKSMAGFEKARQRARVQRQREVRREKKEARALPPRREGSQWED